MTVSRRSLLSSAVAVAGGSLAAASTFARTIRRASLRKPNIILIYADDLGFGDVGCYGATQVATPNIDRLAAEGVRFINGHAPSATCTPSRYALLTGEYAWRKEGAHILPGDAAALIRPGKDTLPSMLKRGGYATALIGKWHLGLGDGVLDWNGRIAPGPREIGFDHAFFFPATADRVPGVFIEDHNVVGLDRADPIRVDYRNRVGDEPIGREHPELLKMAANDGHDGTIVNGIGRIGYMSGGKAARWVDEEVSDVFLGKAQNFIAANREKPFFIYFATTEPHVPRAPAKRFQGATGMGPRGDAIAQLDWTVGELVQTLRRHGLDDDTMIVFSSDNGPVLNDGYDDDAVQRVGNHRPAGMFRSGKYSIYEGGLRVPFIVRWPAGSARGVTSKALISHVDLFASLAAITGQRLPSSSAVDSFELSNVVTGRNDVGRAVLVEDTSTTVAGEASLLSKSDSILALIEGNWKLIAPFAHTPPFAGNEIGGLPEAQLFDLKRDPGETVNLAQRFPEIVSGMQSRLAAILRSTRTRPG